MLSASFKTISVWLCFLLTWGFLLIGLACCCFMDMFLLRQSKLSAWCRAGLHMTAETLGASQVKAIQHAGGKHNLRHAEFLHEEVAQVCASSEWLKCYMGRLGQRRFYRQRNTTAMVLKRRLSSSVTTLAPRARGPWVSSTWGSSTMQTPPRSLFEVSLLDCLPLYKGKLHNHLTS